MSYRKNQGKHCNDHLIDVTFSVKAKASPKLKELMKTTIEAGNTVVKVGQKLIPILLVLGTIATSCSQTSPSPKVPTVPQVESTKKAVQ